MEYLIYLLRINLSLTLFWVVYKLFLSKLTFPSFNRAYFLGAIICSFSLPIIPKNVTEHAVLMPHKTIAIPDFRMLPQSINENAQNINWNSVLIWIYILGAAVLFIHLIIQHYSIYRIYRKAEMVKVDQLNLVLTPNATPAFSFWKYIFIAHSNIDQTQSSFILAHEMQHVKRLHSLDILIIQWVKIICWINPFVWLLAKDMQQNLEYEVDYQLIQTGINPKNYQYQLLHTLIPSHSLTITNHFNLHNLKKRIIMMNKEQSAKIKVIRYFVLLPSILGLISYVQFAQAEHIAQVMHTWNFPKMSALVNVVSTNAPHSVSKQKPITEKKKFQHSNLIDSAKMEDYTKAAIELYDQKSDTAPKGNSWVYFKSLEHGIDSLPLRSSNDHVSVDKQYDNIFKDENGKSVIVLVDGKRVTDINYQNNLRKENVKQYNILTAAQIAQKCPQFKGKTVFSITTK